jgi:hypothetical protein
VSKLQLRLQLLREEYVKLQSRLAEVERENAILVATSSANKNGQTYSGKNFVSEILKKIAELFNQQVYR